MGVEKKLNKPEFIILKNIGYGVEGGIAVLKSKNSFKTQLFFIILIGIGLIFININIFSKLFHFFSTWLILFANAFNSAIKRGVDLVTNIFIL